MSGLPSNDTRLRVYLCLVRGIEGPMCASQVAVQLNMKPSGVAYHIKQLKAGGFIREASGKGNPQFYVRGPQANVLDGLCSNLNIQNDGGTVNPPSSSKCIQHESQVKTARTHINGRVTFQVQKVGDIHPLFDKPYLVKNGVTFWKTKVPYNGKKVSIEFIESAKAQRMNVWPPARQMTAEQLGDPAEKVMLSEAQDVANHLSKSYGWRLGFPEFKGDIEYASTDTELLAEIPESIRTSEAAGCWIDCSEGPREFETKDAEKAKIAISIPGRIQEIERGQRSTVDRTFTVEMKVDRLLALMEKLVKLTELEGEAITNLAEQGILGTVEKAVEKKAEANGNGAKSADEADRYEVMYQ